MWKETLHLRLQVDVKTLWCLNEMMKRATVYFEEDLHKALKIKAVEASTSVSELVNEAVKSSFLEDLEDLEAFRERESEPTVDFESFVKEMKENGRL